DFFLRAAVVAIPLADDPLEFCHLGGQALVAEAQEVVNQDQYDPVLNPLPPFAIPPEALERGRPETAEGKSLDADGFAALFLQVLQHPPDRLLLERVVQGQMTDDARPVFVQTDSLCRHAGAPSARGQ